MAKVYSWAISETKYGYIIHPDYVNKDVLNNETPALITTGKLTGSNLELIKQWAANCTDDEYVMQFDRLKELCKSENIKVNFENVSNYLNINSDCDNLTGPQGKEGRGILRIEYNYADSSKDISCYNVIYTDGEQDKIEIRNGVDGKDGAKGDTPHTQVNLFIYKTGGEDYVAPDKPKTESEKEVNEEGKTIYYNTYNFNTNEFIPPKGWSPTNDIDGPIYMSTGSANSNVAFNDGEKDGIASNIAWSTPSLISGKDGKAGADGDSIEFIYKSSKSLDPIDKPTQNDEDVNGFVPEDEDWHNNPQGVDETNKVEWMCQRVKKIQNEGDTVAKWGDWSTPVIWSKWGENGMDGDGIEYIYLLTKKGTPPDNPTPDNWEDNLDYQDKDSEWWPSKVYDEHLEVFVEWTDEPSGVKSDMPFEWVSSRKYNGATKKWGEFTNPALWAKFGEQGKSGTVTRKLYRKKSNSSTSVIPDLPTDNYYGQWVGVFPEYDISEDVVWSTECELYVHDNSIVYRYRLISSRDDNGDVIYPKGNLSEYDYEEVKTIPVEQINKEYNYLFLENDDLYQWDEDEGKYKLISNVEYPNGSLGEYDYKDVDEIPTERLDKDYLLLTSDNHLYEWNEQTSKYEQISTTKYDVDLNRRDYTYVEIIPSNKYNGKCDYLLLTNGDLYEWKGGWSTPSIVSGIKGETGGNGNSYLPIYCYNEVDAYPSNDGIVGVEYDNFEDEDGCNINGLIWYNLPYSEVEVGKDGCRWYKCTCLVNGSNNKITECGGVEYAFAYDGVSNATIIIFKSGKKTNTNGTISYEAPNKPEGGSYNFNQMKLTDVPNGWKDNQSGLLSPIYSSYGTVSSESPDEITWGEPIRITGDDGKVGADGASIEFIYTREVSKNDDGTSKGSPNKPTQNEKEIDDYIPKINNGNDIDWFDSPQGITKTNTIEWMCQRKKNKTTGKWGDWSTPVIWSKWGEDGVDGDGVEYIYTTTSTNEAPSNPTPDNWEAFVEWTDEPSGVTKVKPFEWVSSRKYNGTDESWGAFSEPKLWAKYIENVEMLETRYKIVTESTTSNDTPYVKRDNYANPDEGNPNTQEKWEKSVGTIDTNDVLWQIQTRSIKNEEGTWGFVEREEWSQPIRLTGKQGEVGVQGIPGIGYQICYCLGTKYTYFGVNPIGNEENNLYENQYRWFKSESMPDSDFIEIEHNGNDDKTKTNIKNVLIDVTNGTSILKNTGRVIKIINNKGEQNESYDYLLINSLKEEDDSSYNIVIPIGSSSTFGLENDLINNIDDLKNIDKDSLNDGVRIWATQGEVKYVGNKPKGANWCKPFTIQGSAGVNGVRGRVIYPAGNYNSTKIYETTPDSAPYVYDTSGEAFYLLNQEMKWLGELPSDYNNLPEEEKKKYEGVATQNGTTPSQSVANNSNNSPWIKFENLEALYASVAVINMGTIGASVYAGDFMFSQFGKIGKKDDNFGTYISTLSNGTQAKFLDGYTVDANGNYKDNGNIIESHLLNPYEKNADGTWKHSFRPATCINFKTGKMWVNYGKVSFGGYTKDSDGKYTEESVNGLYNGIETLKNSFSEDSTEISGGLVLTNFIGLKDSESNITAFINGSTADNGLGKQLKDSVFAAGIKSTDETKEPSLKEDYTTATINLTRNGTNSKIGIFKVYEDGIGVDTGNDKNILITENSIDDYQPSDDGNDGDFIVIGKDGIKNYYKNGVEKNVRFSLRFEECDETTQLTSLFLKNLPTTNTNIEEGQVWNDNGILKIGKGTSN